MTEGSVEKSKRRRRFYGIVLPVLIAAVIAGCNPVDELQRITGGAAAQGESAKHPAVKTGEGYAGGHAAAPDDIPAEQIFEEVDIQDEVPRVSEDRYAYTTLDEETQKVYDEVYQTMLLHEESVRVGTVRTDVLDRAYKAVIADYGEIFWVSGYSYMQYMKGSVMVGIDFSPGYTVTEDERKLLQEQIDAAVTEILAGIGTEASDYEKAKYVYEYLAGNVDYVVSAPDNQNIISVFLNGQTVCQGYACAAQYLLTQLSVQAAIVTGEANGASHAWNLVRLDGEYYYMDATWGNSTYAGEENGEDRFINYSFLGVTTEDMKMTHTANDNFILPECTATQDNYFVRENLYFTEWDPDAVGNLCRAGYESGDTVVSVKFSTAELWETARWYFIDELHISDYCAGITSLYYVEDERQNVLIFRFQ